MPTMRAGAFRIHDESRIRDKTLDNITFLARYTSGWCFPSVESQAVLNTVREMGVATLDYLLFSALYGRYLPGRVLRIYGIYWRLGS